MYVIFLNFVNLKCPRFYEMYFCFNYLSCLLLFLIYSQYLTVTLLKLTKLVKVYDFYIL